MGIINWLFEKPGRDYFDDIDYDIPPISSKESFDNASSRPKRRDLNIMNIRVGDYVTYRNVDYYVRQRYLYKAGVYNWNSYQFSDDSRENELWLDVEEDDQVEINLVQQARLPENVNVQHLETRREIYINNERFTYDEHGYAQVRIENESKKWDFTSVKYWDYYNVDETKFLSIELWDNSELEASVGSPIKDFELDIYPGS